MPYCSLPQVRRRYTDFKVLAAQLEAYQKEHHLEAVVCLFSATVARDDAMVTALLAMQSLSPLPDSEVHKIAGNPSIVKTRMRTLALYLQSLLVVPEWRTSPCFMQL